MENRPGHAISKNRNDDDSNLTSQSSVTRGGNPSRFPATPRPKICLFHQAKKAGEGGRTLDISLGKAALYH